MKPRYVLSLVLVLVLSQLLCAQAGPTLRSAVPDQDRLLEALKDQAILLKIQVRQLDSSGRIVWFNDVAKITVNGRTVAFKLEGGNSLIDTQFTPYRKGREVSLMVQSQILIQGPDQKTVQYNTLIQSLPSVLGETIFYYPLGRRKADGSGPANEIEMEISVMPYESAVEQDGRN